MQTLRYATCLIVLALALSASAQDDIEYRMELGGGIGLGFGINDTNYSFFGQPKASGTLLWRNVFNPRSALKVQAGYTMTGGDTDKMDDFQPAQPLTPSTVLCRKESRL